MKVLQERVVPLYPEKENDAQEILDRIKAKGDSISDYFEELVPAQGKADTVAGELVRAISRLQYRDYNDGDRFYQGYGLETCGPSAAYLIEKGFKDLKQWVENKGEDLITVEDEEYTELLQDVANEIIDAIKENPQMLVTPNEDDSREWNYDDIKELEPKMDFDFTLADGIVRHIEAGDVTRDEVEYEMSTWDYCSGLELTHGDSGMICELSPEEFEYLEGQFDSMMEAYVEQLDEDFPNEEDDEGDYEDEE